MSVPAADRFAVVESRTQFRGWVINVRTDLVRMPDGAVAQRVVVEHPGAVGIVAIDDDGQVVLVRQYRHPVGQLLLELPAGLLDVDDESALASAQRELYEEAHLTADDWSVLVDIHTSPGMTDESIRVFLARGLRDVPEADRYVSEHEELTMTVERFPLDVVTDLAASGELTNGPAIAGVCAARIARDAGWATLRPADAPWPARPGRVGTTAG